MNRIPFSEYLAQIRLGETEIPVFTKNGQCSNCGNCCSNILPLSQSEITRIKKFIAERGLKAEIHTTMRNTFDLVCPFLNQEKRCNIYEIRPLICREYKCDFQAHPYKNLQLLKEKRPTVDVRYTFFGDTQGLPVNFILNIFNSGLSQHLHYGG